VKILLSSRGLFSLCFIVLVATNIIVLSGVASNRSGKPESHIILTERELKLPYRVHEENSGLALRITWRALGNISDNNNYSDWRSPAWFSSEKLKKLGFNINDFLNSNRNATLYKRPISKEVFIVLENDGEQYREAVKRAKLALKREENSFKSNPGDKRLRDNFERAEKRLKREHMEETRLFAIDAGLDASKLREKYGDRTRFIITKGLVKPRLNHNKTKKELFGYISRLSVASINVPLKHRQIFDSILARDKSNKNDFRSPRFEVKLAYGNRLEPWIISVRSLDDKS
jgi:hypothetical protein